MHRPEGAHEPLCASLDEGRGQTPRGQAQVGQSFSRRLAGPSSGRFATVEEDDGLSSQILLDLGRGEHLVLRQYEAAGRGI